MIDPQALTDAVSAHSQWKFRLTDAITKGSSEYQVATVSVDNGCAFGKWLYGLSPEDQNNPFFPKIKDLHAKFHTAAAHVLDLALQGNKEEATKAMEHGSEYINVSTELVLEIGNWKQQLQPAAA
jgi:hypothetical protein